MSSVTLFDALLDILERRRRDNPYIELSPENQTFLTQAALHASSAPTPATPTPAALPPTAPADDDRTPKPAPQPPGREPPAAEAPNTAAQPTAEPIDLGNTDLVELETMVSACTRCELCKERNRTAFADGSADADLMFIGEGPGADEDREGIPFVGAAGQLLTKIIGAMKIRREDVYIANIVKCRPPRNRNPEPDEAAACLPYLERQIELVAPKVIITLGAVPLRFLLDQKGIRRQRGNWLDYKGIPVMPTFHPSYLLRVPDAKRDVWNDMQQIMVRLGIQK
ncbi:MAG: uracil-DNA glycosylase [Lentisphaeria bacterium]|jgi:DNA polymerase|nr:uracil-DNA glycosylase [Lentisphaeria bacterium]MDP7743576.1 uracil-DNA glycosylase [Lentisphaeria bacterium]